MLFQRGKHRTRELGIVSVILAALFAAGVLLSAVPVWAGQPESIAFLEEHLTKARTPYTVGAYYEVPRERKATLSGFYCEIRSGDLGQVALLLVVIPSKSVIGPATVTAGMNPILCISGPGYRVSESSGASMMLRPGDVVYALYANLGTRDAFTMLSAWIYEEDLP